MNTYTKDGHTVSYADADRVEHVVTHAHGDHTGCTAWICNHTGAPLANKLLASSP